MQRRNAILVLVLSIAGACEEEPCEYPATPPSAPDAPARGDGDATKPEGSASTPVTPSVDAPTEPAPKLDRREAYRARLRVPDPVERSGTEWPFHAWDRAEALSFNDFVSTYGPPLHVYDQHGWSPHIVERKPLDEKLAKRAFALVKQAGGAMKVSKCPFPRHAVVLYAGDVPVASINVCFECGDVLLWPEWEPKPRHEVDWDRMSERQIDRLLRKQTAFYDTMLSRWKVFFRDRVGLEIDESKYR